MGDGSNPRYVAPFIGKTVSACTGNCTKGRGLAQALFFTRANREEHECVCGGVFYAVSVSNGDGDEVVSPHRKPIIADKHIAGSIQEEVKFFSVRMRMRFQLTPWRQPRVIHGCNVSLVLLTGRDKALPMGGVVVNDFFGNVVNMYFVNGHDASIAKYACSTTCGGVSYCAMRRLVGIVRILMKKRASEKNDPTLVTNSIIILFMIIVGIGWYLSTLLKPPQPDTPPVKQNLFNTAPKKSLPTPVAGVTERFTGTMAALIAKGQSMECEVASGPSGAGGITGKLWTFSAVGRSNITVPLGGGASVIANTVFDGDAVYSWYDMTGNVLGYRIDPSASASSYPKQKHQIATVLAQNLTFTCKAWTPDPRVLTLPPNVNFN